MYVYLFCLINVRYLKYFAKNVDVYLVMIINFVDYVFLPKINYHSIQLLKFDR